MRTEDLEATQAPDRVPVGAGAPSKTDGTRARTSFRALLWRRGSRFERVLGILGSVLRTALAAGLVWVCLQDGERQAALAGFEAVPTFDYWKQANTLLDQERFSEAELVIEAGLAARPEQSSSLNTLKRRVEIERGSWMHRFQQLGEGALRGTGESLEAVAGAVVADLFVFGDVRDLVVQAGRKLKGQDTDEVLVALSAAGLLLTANPAADLGGALLKFARRIGALGNRLAADLAKLARRAVQSGDGTALVKVTSDAAGLSKAARPAGALHILRSLETTGELRYAAKFAQRDGGTFALWIGGRDAWTWLRSGAPDASTWLLRASKRGPEGLRYLGDHAKVMFRPHPVLGLAKGLWKGNIPKALVELGRAWTHFILALAIAWLSFEGVLLFWRLIGI